MKRYLYIAVSSILSGLLIVIGACVYLSCLKDGKGDYMVKIFGAMFFSIGLFSIITWQNWLYTGKVGLVLDNKPKYFLDLLVCILFNFIGVILFALLIRATRFGDGLSEVAKGLVEQKQADSWYSILILSFFCGIMIYIAVKGYAICENSFGKVFLCVLGVAVFILCGFEHVIANAAYYTLAGIFNWKAFLYFIIMAIGNGLGSITFDGLIKLQNKLKEQNKNAQ